MLAPFSYRGDSESTSNNYSAQHSKIIEGRFCDSNVKLEKKLFDDVTVLFEFSKIHFYLSDSGSGPLV